LPIFDFNIKKIEIKSKNGVIITTWRFEAEKTLRPHSYCNRSIKLSAINPES